MDIQEFARLFAEAQNKLDGNFDPASGKGAVGAPDPAGDPGLSRREQVILLAGLLMGQSTRKEKRYGQA